MKVINRNIIYFLIILLLPLLTCAKSRSDTIFSKYTYTSNYTDKALFQSTFSDHHLNMLRNETKNLFNYAWNKYLEFGYPFDEIKPISCQPNVRDNSDPFNTVKNDILGNFSLTLFDSLDTFIIMNDHKGFTENLIKIEKLYKDFAIDSTIQIFEVNIRILGSLLTSHLYAIDPRRGYKIDSYDGFLLKLAYDLGKRLSISFLNDNIDGQYDEKKGIDNNLMVFNKPRTNLLTGNLLVDKELQTQQCTAGLTSLILEFTLLSKLTNDSIFEDLTKSSLINFWNLRTSLDLLPMTFNTELQAFTDMITGVGASIDSFYEYSLKTSIVFNDNYLYDIWYDSYKSLLTHSQNKDGIFLNVNVNNGIIATEWIDSLSAFFPGLQILSGDIKNSIDCYLIFLKLWNSYGSMPERWNFSSLASRQKFKYLNRDYKVDDTLDGINLEMTNEFLLKNSINLEWYPLRPEFIESTYHLYKATKDPIFLRIGEDFLERFRDRFIAPCGFSGVLNILTEARQDRMESFVLSETLKYLYLLFTVDNDSNKDGNKNLQNGNMVFTTEGHPIWFDKVLYQFDPINPTDLQQMNKIEEDELNNELADHNKGNFLERFLNVEITNRNKKFNLNKEFDRLKRNYYSHNKNNFVVRVDPIVYQCLTELNHDMDELEIGTAIMLDESTFNYLSHYKKIIKIKVKEIESKNNLKLDGDYLGLNICERHENKNPNWKFSDLLSYNKKFYEDDYNYRMTLRKPIYLENRRFLELDAEFYIRFGDSNNLTCQRSQETEEFEALIATADIFPVASIYKLRKERNVRSDDIDKSHIHPKPEDLYIEELEGFRIVIEKLEKGKLDSYGDFIDSEYLSKWDENKPEGKVVRIVKINGYKMKKGEIIWVNNDSEYLKSSSTIKVLPDGHLNVKDSRVENMKVWIG